MRFYEYESRAIVRDADTGDRLRLRPPPPPRHARSPSSRRSDRDQVTGAHRRAHEGRRRAVRRRPEEAAAHAEAILRLEIGGHMPRGVLVDPRAQVKQEYYAGVVWDGTRKRPLLLFSDMGGIDIEQVAKEHPDHVAGAT